MDWSLAPEIWYGFSINISISISPYFEIWDILDIVGLGIEWLTEWSYRHRELSRTHALDGIEKNLYMDEVLKSFLCFPNRICRGQLVTAYVGCRASSSPPTSGTRTPICTPSRLKHMHPLVSIEAPSQTA